MDEKDTITPIRVESELVACPSCGYGRGFHTTFLNVNSSKDNPVRSTKEVYRVILVCPECGARFDVGWRVSFAEPESKFVKTTIIGPGAP